jgi:glycosyltransferase involved in cell wall biosynthesis
VCKQFYLSKCHAFVFPSIREGFGLPQAMHFGKPVFLSNKTSLPEVGGKHAYYWDNLS